MIRPVVPDDLDALYSICLQTGADGSDATGRFKNPQILGEVYVGPYVVLPGCIGFTYQDIDGPAGYVLGTVDTRALEVECEANWWPRLRSRYPDPGPGPYTFDDEIAAHIHHPPAAPPKVVDQYPAHLHMDLLPRLQGRGLGRTMLERLIATMQRRGVTGLHLEVSSENTRAIGFYEHLGFATVATTNQVIYMGMQLDSGAQRGADGLRD